MKLNLSIKGQALTLNHAEVNDLLRGLEFALGGGSGQRSFGCVTAHSDGFAAGGSKGAGGAMHFKRESSAGGLDRMYRAVEQLTGKKIPRAQAPAESQADELGF